MALLPIRSPWQIRPGTASLRTVTRVVSRTTLCLLLLLIAAELWVRITAPYSLGAAGLDYRTYADAARAWLTGGPFYPAFQTIAPYQLDNFSGAVLYPPTMLVLLVPFVFLGGFLWSAIPLAILAAVIWHHRPSSAGWVVILAFVAFSPEVQTLYWFGTPTIWIAAFVALGTLWGWPGALILLKPAVFPFAVIGIRSRGWWITAAIGAAVSLLFLPMWIDWIHVLLNARGPRASLLYALGDLPLLLIPVVAWVARRPEAASLRAAPEREPSGRSLAAGH